MIPAVDRWGPWRPGIAPAERLARLRSLRALAHVTLGSAFAAYRTAIRRQGANLAEAAGANGLRAALERVAALAPQHAQDRRTIVSAAWAGLTC